MTVDREGEGAQADAPLEPAVAGDHGQETSGSRAQLFAAISDLWEVDVDETEMAVRFDP